MTAYVKSEIRYNIHFCKANYISKQEFSKFTLNKVLITNPDEINYISVVCNLIKINNMYLSKLARCEAVNCTYEALVYCYVDLYLNPLIDDHLSAPLAALALKILKNTHLAKDYVSSAYNILPDVYKNKY